MLEIRELSKTFAPDKVNKEIALDNLSLTLEEGEFITVIGSNGAGKSTLLNCISGVHLPDAGRIILDGMDITFWPEYKRSRYIGRVFQDPLLGTAFDMTIEENLAMAYAKGKTRGLLPGVRRNETRLFRDKLAELGLGLEDRIRQKVGFLSGGERQALTLLMATIVRPRLLLLDEHTAALDPATAQRVLKLTRDIVLEHQLTTIMVTHNMREALEYGTRTVMMHNGRLILDIAGPERENMTVEKLVSLFSQRSGSGIENDRMLLG
ncbi:MAG TPA: ATP-binding cassette domain-containing protein [Syntrophothermus lipocalidus]|uniref:ABC transporter related protein n=1 Tax=Syntrophothermus lipocalidus (strain DSM 12680 / TGB-C1) TaxID=643648 RepID=D7CML0_SYNLT|nr:ATP-binding cassette domain-containing protein [Syntrophothermus lipocalidus]ADI01945.1 ABC transporter related protein [Syntrophothermus lipocalidus DSM 12680]HHV76747.1 ATP-binding cassette domain-containing protein [Syntrophothermus lipocalidus]